MEFPKRCRVVLLAAFCMLVSVVAADLNEEKQKAIKDLNAQMNSISELFKKTSDDAENQQNKTEKVVDYIVNYGEKVTISAVAIIRKFTSVSDEKGIKKNCTDAFFTCTEDSETSSIVDANNYYAKGFLDLIDSLELKAEKERKEIFENWKEDSSKAFDKYSTTHTLAVTVIQAATNQNTISSMVKICEKAAAQVTDIINSILPKTNNIHIQLLKTVDEAGDTLKKYTEDKVKKHIEQMNACFDKCH